MERLALQCPSILLMFIPLRIYLHILHAQFRKVIIVGFDVVHSRAKLRLRPLDAIEDHTCVYGSVCVNRILFT